MKRKLVTIFVVILSLCCLLSACQPEEPKEATYKVEHYQEALDGTYALVDTDSLTGKVGDEITAQSYSPKTYEGFTFDAENTQSVLTGTLAEDGLTLKLYYKRNTYTVTFKNGSEVFGQPLTVKYGAKISAPATEPTKASTAGTSYVFAGWYNGATAWNFATGEVKSNLVLDAKFEDSTNKYAVTFKDSTGAEMQSGLVAYGTVPTAPAHTVLAGYTFGWDKEIVAVTGEIVYNETKTANTDTYYCVQIYAESLAGEFGLFTTLDMSGTTDTQASVTTDNMPALPEGYELDSANEDNKLSGNIAGDGSLVLKVYLKLKMLTVSFKNEGEAFGQPLTVKYGAKVSAPENPTKEKSATERYEFDGWYNGDAKWDFATDVVDANVELTAKWNAISYFTVSFDTDGGNSISSQEIDSGNKCSMPVEPVKDGNVFEGWFNGETAFNFETAITENVSLKAKWSVGSIYHEAEDDSWGCSFDVWNTEYSEGDNVEVTLKVKSKNASGLALLADSSFGEQFVCPFDGANSFGSVTSWTEVTFIATIKADGKLQLKYGNSHEDAATNNFTVYFKDISMEKIYGYKEAKDNSWDGSFDVCSTEYSEGDNVEVTLKVKSKNASGLALLADSSFGEQFVCPFDGANSFGSVTSWTEVTFIATIKADGKLQLKYGNSNGGAATNNFTVYFKDISMEKIYGYKEAEDNSWGCSFDVCSTEYSQGDCIEVSLKVKSKNASGLCLQTITADGDKMVCGFDGENSFGSVTSWTEVTFIAQIQADGKLQMKYGNSNGGAATNNFSVYFKDLSVLNVIKCYSVTFVTGTDATIEAQKIVEGGKVTAPAALTKGKSATERYEFDGWYNGDAKWDFATDVVNANVELTAKWNAISYFTVSFDTDGGNSISSQEIDSGNKCSMPVEPVKDGNVFEGWFNGETAFNFETAITENVSLKAKWSVGSIYHEAEDDSWGCSFDVWNTEYSEGDNVEVTLKVKSKNASGLALLADSSFGEQFVCPFDGANSFGSVTSWTEVTFIATIKADGKLQLKYGNSHEDAATNNFTVYFKDISMEKIYGFKETTGSSWGYLFDVCNTEYSQGDNVEVTLKVKSKNATGEVCLLNPAGQFVCPFEGTNNFASVTSWTEVTFEAQIQAGGKLQLNFGTMNGETNNFSVYFKDISINKIYGYKETAESDWGHAFDVCSTEYSEGDNVEVTLKLKSKDASGLCLQTLAGQFVCPFDGANSFGSVTSWTEVTFIAQIQADGKLQLKYGNSHEDAATNNFSVYFKDISINKIYGYKETAESDWGHAFDVCSTEYSEGDNVKVTLKLKSKDASGLCLQTITADGDKMVCGFDGENSFGSVTSWTEVTFIAQIQADGKLQLKYGNSHEDAATNNFSVYFKDITITQ